MNSLKYTRDQNRGFLRMLLFLLIFGGFTHESQAQKVADSLKNVSYDYMWERYYADTTRTAKIIYTDAIIARTKKEGDTATLMGGYELRSYLYNDEPYLKYLDSIIKLGITNPIYSYPEKAFSSKGKYFYRRKNLKKALQDFLKANQFDKKNSKILTYQILYYLALIKDQLGDKTAALDIYKKNLEYVKKRNSKSKIKELQILFNMSTIYNQIGKLDTASYYIDTGLKISEKVKNSYHYYNFLANKGINFYYRKDLIKSEKLLKLSLDSLQRIANKAHVHLYLGKINQEFEKSAESLRDFKIADSIVDQIKATDPFYREIYINLIDHYKKRKNLKNQFLYLKKLIKIDSINHDNEVYLNRNLFTDYEIPKLKAERDQIIQNIKFKDSRKRIWIILLFIASAIILSGFIYQFQKRKSYQTRFLALIHQQEEQVKEQPAIKNIEFPETLDISEDIVNHILNELKQFEHNRGYLQSDLTLSVLAKQINSNTRYLSKVISYHKQKTFIQYINDLRVKYAVERLKTDEYFRKYTLLAIANELGFKKSESFTKAFKKVTGITPAYYIRELKKEKYPNS